MKKIAIFCVTYNSYQELNTYKESIVNAVTYCKDCIVDLFIADNTICNYQTLKNEKIGDINIKVFSFHKNYGYFGSIQRMMKINDVFIYDFCILSNVDVKMTPQTLYKLCNNPIEENIGWIAPQTFSISEKRDLNPALTQRYSRLRIKILRLFYKYPILLRTYEKTLYKRKKILKYSSQQNKEIYAGHGSFIILTQEYFKRCGIINYPVFLYDEELYLAEECRIHNLKVIYSPNIIINDIGKVSTGKLPNDFYCKCNLEGIEYILKTYY